MMYLGIDPSVNNVGIALYDSETNKLQTTVFHPKRIDEDWTEIAKQTRNFIIIWMAGRKINFLITEYPSWQDSAKGRIAAKKGYTLYLAFLAGYLGGCLPIIGDHYTPTPMEWKKNLPKNAVGLRFERRFGISKDSVTDHEFEAAMMIAWLIDSLE